MVTVRGGLVAALCALSLVGCGGDSSGETVEPDPPAWNHDPADVELGPTAWSGIDESFEECAAGAQQSPVDIVQTTPTDLPELALDYPATPIVVENTGHTIEAVLPDDGGQTLTIEGTEYRLLQYHFHAPSEHTLDGRSFPAEVHLVHESDEGELAVVGVFLEDEGLPSGLADTVIESAPETSGEEVEVEDAPSPLLFMLVADAFRASGTDYFAYRGSLTTPGCTEGVRWIVLRQAGGISAGAVDRLHELIAGFPGYDGYENNNRPVQPLNERTIERAGAG